MSITVKTKGLDELQKRFANSPKVVQKYSQPAMQSSVDLVRRNIAPLTPSATGTLRGSLEGQVRGMGTHIKGLVQAGKFKPYFAVQEYGRKSKKFPNVNSIAANMGLDKNAAYLVARAIARRGTTGYKYMQRGWDKSQKAVNQFFREAIHKIARELEG